MVCIAHSAMPNYGLRPVLSDLGHYYPVEVRGQEIVGEPLREVKMEEKQIGTVDHFFGNISVSMIRLTDTLKVGDKIRIKGSTSNLVQDVASMQIDRVPAQEAKSGDLVSIKVAQKVRKDDAVYKL